MGEFLKEHIESIMMIAFVVATALGMYKVYVMFEKQADDGVDINTLEDEIVAILKGIVQKEPSVTKEALFEKIQKDAAFDEERYFNFNQNRFNQILERLYIETKTESFEDLKKLLSDNRKVDR